VLAINRYLELRHGYSVQSKTMAVLVKELEDQRKAMNRSNEHLTFLQEYARHLEEAAEQVMEASKAEKPAAKHSETSPAEKAPKGREAVHIEDLVIQKQGSRMLVSFRLVNTQPGNTPVTGYLHLLAKGALSDPPKEWVYPQGKVINGFPENYRKGQGFTIHRFKPIQGHFNLDPGTETPSSVRVLIYDQTGAVILQNDFEITP